MAKKAVANLLIDTLVAAGVKRVYGLAETLLMELPILSGLGMTSNGLPCDTKKQRPLRWEQRPI
jgi:hypothetical protein